MKAKLFIVISLASSLLLTACHTALNLPPISTLKGDFGQPNMEFLGFVNPQRSEQYIAMFRNFGRELEKNHIAVNQQAYSLGSTFTSESLAGYQSPMRYVSYVTLLDYKVKYDDEISDNIAMKKAGWCIAGLTLFALYPVYVPLLACGNKNDCQQKIQLQAELCIYDTQLHQELQVIPIKFNYKEIYKGQYANKKTDKEAIEATELTMATNVLLQYYGNAHTYVQQLIDEENKRQEEMKQKENKKKNNKNNKNSKGKKRSK